MRRTFQKRTVAINGKYKIQTEKNDINYKRIVTFHIEYT